MNTINETYINALLPAQHWRGSRSTSLPPGTGNCAATSSTWRTGWSKRSLAS